MDKEKYIEQGRLRLLQSSLNTFLPFGSLFLILLSVLDYVVTPENYPKFLTYRLIAASLGMGLFSIFRLKKSRDKHFMLAIIILATLIPSVMVELMILSFGGHQSIYYVGMIVVLIFILGFLPISTRMTALVNGITYAVYFIPIVLLDHITNVRIFINNNIFFIASVFGSLGWRHFNYNLLIKNLSLEYDLKKDKEQLAIYSNRLEQLVGERTRELSISEQKYKALFDNANDGVVVLDRNGFIVNVNQRFCELHGFEKDALLGTHIRLLEADGDTDEKTERMSGILNGESLLFETGHYRKDGNKILLEVSSRAIDIGGELYIQSFHRDITEKKRLQEQLFQSQKMESIGILVGGIAHDFNNILVAILGHAELLNESPNLEPDEKQRVRTIENSGRRASQMVSKLLSFARKSAFEIVPVNLNDIIRDTVELLERMIFKKGITLKTETDYGIPAINGDGTQLEQVIMNLLVNAMDAMPGGGRITIATSLENLERDASQIHPLLTPGRYAVLKISDTGTGIPEEIRDRIFDPFFTTKETGKGTGLGLSMVYGIVKDHKGTINVRSLSGKGTTFEIYLPATGKPVQKIGGPFVYSMSGREKILIIDDERDILSFIKDVLEKRGYRVMVTDNPVYALDIFKELRDEIDLVITDIVMPLIDGRELIRHFKTIKPSVRIVAISGYETGDIENKGVNKDNDIDAFIIKPFEGIYLLSTVRKILDTKSYTKQNPYI